MNNNSFIKLLKEKTTVSKSFINKFFKNFRVGDDLLFHIDEMDVCEYINITKKSLRNRLLKMLQLRIHYLKKK